jgi:hypothetical protein
MFLDKLLHIYPMNKALVLNKYYLLNRIRIRKNIYCILNYLSHIIHINLFNISDINLIPAQIQLNILCIHDHDLNN